MKNVLEKLIVKSSRKATNVCGILLLLMVSSCSTIDKNTKFEADSSYLESIRSGETNREANQSASAADKSPETESSIEQIKPLRRGKVGFQSDVAISERFSNQLSIKISADTMGTTDFVHYVFGELLKANYILGQGMDTLDGDISINVQEEISPRDLYSLSEELLAEQNVSVSYQDNLLYISRIDDNTGAATAVGYGRTADSVPNSVNVIQIVPLKFIPSNSLLRPIREVTRAKPSLDVSQGVVFLSGERQQVIRATELIALLDAPTSVGRHVALLKLIYMSPSAFIESITEILQNEGIIAPTGRNDRRVGFVEIGQLGAVAVFASEQEFVDRVEYWASQIDRPGEGNEKNYFVYVPKFARASDLGDSVKALITGKSQINERQEAQNDSEQRTAAIENTQSTTSTASSPTISMVVDERSNSLIFYTSGIEYRTILPLIERLDVLPKQIMLELTVAEVTLTDEFKFGVDIALRSGKFVGNNNFGATTNISGSALSWINGLDRVDVRAFQSNNLVNVLSRPSILVRDGISANIEVGTSIPIVGQTTTDPTTGTTRSVEYRKTGITLNVTPTVNAQGIVIMAIEQSNSNEVDGGATVEGNPQIFERSIQTEVVAESGQTIILGGLISENNSDNDSGLPGLHKLPIIGALFGVQSETITKTELVVMVTPRIISRTDEWDELKQQLQQGLEFLELK